MQSIVKQTELQVTNVKQILDVNPCRVRVNLVYVLAQFLL